MEQEKENKIESIHFQPQSAWLHFFSHLHIVPSAAGFNFDY
jgi:hypothetical protein